MGAPLVGHLLREQRQELTAPRASPRAPQSEVQAAWRRQVEELETALHEQISLEAFHGKPAVQSWLMVSSFLLLGTVFEAGDDRL